MEKRLQKRKSRQQRVRRIILGMLAGLLLVVLLGPFFIPVPPLTDTRSPAELADPDSRFIEINGIDLHYKDYGQGEPAFLLLHGFASSEYSWREVIGPLAARGRVIAFDRPAFGLTERPLVWEGQNPYSAEAQVELTLGLMNALDIEQAILVGNSAGGTVSMEVALAAPERVVALVLVDPAVYTGRRSSPLMRLLMSTPQATHLGPLFVRNIQSWGLDFARRAWHDPQKLTDEIWDGYTRPLKVENWDQALWELTRASRPSDLPARLDELALPILVLTGDDDQIVPAEQSVRLAGELPNAQLVVIPECGHVPHEECPEAFLRAVTEWLEQIY